MSSMAGGGNARLIFATKKFDRRSKTALAHRNAAVYKAAPPNGRSREYGAIFVKIRDEWSRSESVVGERLLRRPLCRQRVIPSG